MRRLLLFILFISCKIILTAQESSDDQKNVVINQAEHSVQVKEKSNKIYTCNSYRTEISIVEFYDDQQMIENVSILVGNQNSMAYLLNMIIKRKVLFNAIRMLTR